MVMGAHMGNLSPAARQMRCRRILLRSPIRTLQNRTEGFEDLLLMTVPCRAVWAMRSWLAPLVNRRKASVWALKGLHYLANAFAAEGTLCVRRHLAHVTQTIDCKTAEQGRTRPPEPQAQVDAVAAPVQHESPAAHSMQQMHYCAACSKPRTR